MNHDIRAIFVDVGDTTADSAERRAAQSRSEAAAPALAGTTEPPEIFCARLNERYEVYRKWAFETMIEASEKELWTRWMLPDFPATRLRRCQRSWLFQYRQSKGRRVVPPDVKPTIIELDKRGYVLGIYQQLITEQEIPDCWKRRASHLL